VDRVLGEVRIPKDSRAAANGQRGQCEHAVVSLAAGQKDGDAEATVSLNFFESWDRPRLDFSGRW
jgi:hypothetical protein